MKTEWKESGIKKRDFKHSKSEPEVPKHKKKRKGKYTHELVALNFKWWNSSVEKEYVVGRYINHKGAIDALKNQQSDYMFSKYDLVVREL